MIRFFALTSVFFAAASAGAESGFVPAPSFSRPHPAVVRVVAPERGGASYGSGVLAAVNESSGLVLTNWHVVRDAASKISVYFPDGFHSGAYLLGTDRDWDLAALAIRRPNVPPVRLSNRAPQPGDVLTIAGYGSGSYRALTGRMTQYVSPGGNFPFEMIELSAPAREGDSGGPIFNQQGELAGILFGSAFGRTTGSYCGRVRWFYDSVAQNFQRISAQAMLAQRSQPSRETPAASIPAPLAAEKEPPCNVLASLPPLGAIRNAENDQTREKVAADAEESMSKALPNPRYSDGVEAAIPSPTRGPLPTSDQVKTVLALIGVAAVFFQVLRLLGLAIG